MYHFLLLLHSIASQNHQQWRKSGHLTISLSRQAGNDHCLKSVFYLIGNHAIIQEWFCSNNQMLLCSVLQKILSRCRTWPACTRICLHRSKRGWRSGRRRWCRLTFLPMNHSPILRIMAVCGVLGGAEHNTREEIIFCHAHYNCFETICLIDCRIRLFFDMTCKGQR